MHDTSSVIAYNSLRWSKQWSNSCASLPSVACAHCNRSKTIPMYNRQFADIPSAPSLLLVLRNHPASRTLIHPGERPSPAAAPQACSLVKSLRALLKLGAICVSSECIVEVSVVNKTSDQSIRVWTVNEAVHGSRLLSAAPRKRHWDFFRDESRGALPSVHPSLCGAARHYEMRGRVQTSNI